jgi:hypothetical protein
MLPTTDCTALPLMTVDASELVGATGRAAPSASVSRLHNGGQLGGSFKVTLNGETTSAIAVDGSSPAASMEAALQALPPSLIPGGVVRVEPSAEIHIDPFRSQSCRERSFAVTFPNVAPAEDVAEVKVEVDVAALTFGEGTTPGQAAASVDEIESGGVLEFPIRSSSLVVPTWAHITNSGSVAEAVSVDVNSVSAVCRSSGYVRDSLGLGRVRDIGTGTADAAVVVCGGSDSGCRDIGEADGDCDRDSDCSGNLICGVDNCEQTSGIFDSTDDCCMAPTGWRSGPPSSTAISDGCTFAFDAVITPVLHSVDPRTGTDGDNLMVTLSVPLNEEVTLAKLRSAEALAVEVGGTACAITSATATVTDTDGAAVSISCTLGEGAGQEMPVLVTIASIGYAAGTSTTTFSYPLPPSATVSSVSPSQGSYRGGSTITIRGSGFCAGSTGVECDTVSVSVVWVPAASTASESFPCPQYEEHEPPADSSSRSSRSAWVAVTDGTCVREVDVSTTAVAEAACNISTVSASEIICATSTAAIDNRTGTVAGVATVMKLRVRAKEASSHTSFIDSTLFTYTASATPIVTSVSPSYGSVAGGNTLTLTGSSLAIGAATNVTAVVKLGGGLKCDVLAASATEITCVVSVGAPLAWAGVGATSVLAHPLSVSVAYAGVAIADVAETATFTYTSSMQVTSITPTSVYGGAEVTISGTNLLGGGSDSSAASVKVGNASCVVSAASTTSRLTCTLASDARSAYAVAPVVVTVEGAGVPLSRCTSSSDGSCSVRFGAGITGMAPSSGSIEGGTILTLTGAGFGEQLVLVGGQVCETDATLSTETQIVCEVPPQLNTATTASEVGMASGFWSCAAVGGCSFQYDESLTPTVAAITPATGAVGTTLTLSGSNFGADASSVSVMLDNGVGEASCTVVAATESEIRCTVGAGADVAGNYSLLVTVAPYGSADVAAAARFVVQITFSLVSSSGSGSVAGGAEVQLVGTGFGAETEVHVGGQSCEVTYFTPTTLTCTSAPMGQISYAFNGYDSDDEDDDSEGEDAASKWQLLDESIEMSRWVTASISPLPVLADDVDTLPAVQSISTSSSAWRMLMQGRGGGTTGSWVDGRLSQVGGAVTAWEDAYTSVGTVDTYAVGPDSELHLSLRVEKQPAKYSNFYVVIIDAANAGRSFKSLFNERWAHWSYNQLIAVPATAVAGGDDDAGAGSVLGWANYSWPVHQLWSEVYSRERPPSRIRVELRLCSLREEGEVHFRELRVQTGGGRSSSRSSTSSSSTLPASCLELHRADPAAASGEYNISTSTGTNLRVYCDMVTDGGGYTFYPVDAGVETRRSTDWDSCKAVGLKMVVPRTKEHLDFMVGKYGTGYFAVVPGISKPTSGGSYSKVAMRNLYGDFDGGGTHKFKASDWRPVDGSTWYLRDTPYIEPNGDYDANCWLSMWWSGSEVRFNDGRCMYATSKYVCSTNDKEEALEEAAELVSVGAVGRTGTNLALFKPTTQSTQCCGGNSARAVDGDPSPSWHDNSCTHTGKEREPWWMVDLLEPVAVARLRLSARDCCTSRLGNFHIYVGNSSAGPTGGDDGANVQCPDGKYSVAPGDSAVLHCGASLVGRYVYVFKPYISTVGEDYLTICEAEVYGSGTDDVDICTDHLLPIGTVVAPPEPAASAWQDYTASVKVQVPVEGAVGMLVRHQVQQAPTNSSAAAMTNAVRELLASAKLHESFDCATTDPTVARYQYAYAAPTAAIADATASGRALLSDASFEWSANLSPFNNVEGAPAITPKAVVLGYEYEKDLSVTDGYTTSHGLQLKWVIGDVPAESGVSGESRSLEMAKLNEGNQNNNWVGATLITKVGDTVRLKFWAKFISAVPSCDSSYIGSKKHKGSGPSTDCSWMASCTTGSWCFVQREWLEDQPDMGAQLVIIMMLDRAPQNTRVRIAGVTLQVRNRPMAVLGGRGALYSNGPHSSLGAAAAAATSPAKCMADGIMGQALHFEERADTGWHAVAFTPPLPVLPTLAFRGHVKFDTTTDLDLTNVAAAYNAGSGATRVEGVTFEPIESATVAFSARYFDTTWGGAPTQYSGNNTHGLNSLMYSMRHDSTISMRIGGLTSGRGYKLQLLFYERSASRAMGLYINREYRDIVDPFIVQEGDLNNGGTIYEAGFSATCTGEVLVELKNRGGSPILQGVVVNEITDADQAEEYMLRAADSGAAETCEAEGALEVGRGNYTVSVWVFPERSDDSARTVVTKGNDHSTWDGWSIYVSKAQVYLRGKATSASGGQRWSLTLGHQLPLRQWSHITMVISRDADGTSTLLRGYVNSELSGERVLPAAMEILAREGAPLTAGRASARWSSAFLGRVDELAVWQRALSTADIAILYSTSCAHKPLSTTAAVPPREWHDYSLPTDKSHQCGGGCSGNNNAWLPVGRDEYQWASDWTGPKQDNWTATAFTGASNETAYVYIGNGCCSGISGGSSKTQFARWVSSRTECKVSCDENSACVGFAVDSASGCADDEGSGDCADMVSCTHYMGVPSVATGIRLSSSTTCTNYRCYAKALASWSMGTVEQCKLTCARHPALCGGYQYISTGVGSCGPDADETTCSTPGACYYRQDPAETLCPTPAPAVDYREGLAMSCHAHSAVSSVQQSALTRSCLPLERLAPDHELQSLAAASPPIPSRQRRSFYRVTLGCSLARGNADADTDTSSDTDADSADCLQLAAQSYEGTLRVLDARRAPKGLLKRGEWYTLATEVVTSSSGNSSTVRVSLDGQLLLSAEDAHPVPGAGDDDSAVMQQWSLHRGGVAIFSAGADKAAFDDLSVRFPLSALASTAGAIEVRSDDGDAGVSVGVCSASAGCTFSFTADATPVLLTRTINDDDDRTITLRASGVPYADEALVHVTVGGFACPIVPGSLRLLTEAEGGIAGMNSTVFKCTPAHTSIGAGTHAIDLSVEGKGMAYGQQLRADGRELSFEVELQASANRTTGSIAGGQEMSVVGVGMATAAAGGNTTGSTSTSLVVCGAPVQQKAASGDSELETLVARTGSILPTAVVADESSLGLNEDSSDSGDGVVLGAVQETEAKVGARADNAIEDVSTGEVKQRPDGWRFQLTNSPSHLSAVRFRGGELKLPPAVRVTDARVTFRSYGRSTGPLRLRIWAESSSAAENFGVYNKEEAYDLSRRNKTSASVVWSPEDWRGSGEDHASADLSPVLNELVARDDWTSFSAVVLLFRMEGMGSEGSSGGVITPRVAVSWDGFSGQHAARLRVVYREARTISAADKECAVSVLVRSPSAYIGSGGCSAKKGGSANLLALEGVTVKAATNGGGSSGTVWVQLLARSAGLLLGNRASLRVNNQVYADAPARGLHLVVIDGRSGEVVEEQYFDTHWLGTDAERLGKRLSECEQGDIVMLAAKDDASNKIRESPRLMEALRVLGAPDYGVGPAYRGSYALIARVGFPQETALSVSTVGEAVVERVFACGDTAATMPTAQAFAAVGSGSSGGTSLVVGTCAACAAPDATYDGADLWADKEQTTCGSCGESNNVHGVDSTEASRYWMLGSVDECKTACTAAADQCGGFNYVNHSSHSCGLDLDDTKCHNPGACYFRRTTGCHTGTDAARSCHTLRRFPRRDASSSSSTAYPCVDSLGRCSGPSAGGVSCPSGFWRCANADITTVTSSAAASRATSARIFRRTGFKKWPQKSVVRTMGRARIGRMEQPTDRRAIDSLDSFWLFVGSPDATLTFALGQLVTVERIEIDWAAAPRRLLVLSRVSGEDSTAAGGWTELLSKRRRRGLKALRYSLVKGKGAGAGGVPMDSVRFYMDDAVAVTPPSTNMGRGSPFIAIAKVRLLGCGREVQKDVTEEDGSSSSSRRRMLTDSSSSPSPLFSYSLLSTPNITAVSPSRGSSAGGTRITITGTGLQATTTSTERRRLSVTSATTEVKIAGKVCNVTSVSPTAIECTTGFHGVTDSTGPGHASVEVWVPGKGYAAASSAAAARYHYIDLWSRHTTWGGGPLPVEDDLVHVPTGNNVLLDMSPPRLSALIVEGKLR